MENSRLDVKRNPPSTNAEPRRNGLDPQSGASGDDHLLHLHEKSNVLRTAMDEIRPALEKGEMKPIIDRTFPLTAPGATEAHEYLHQRRNIGKVVLVSGTD